LDGEDIVSYVEVFDFEHSQRWRAREFRNRKAYELFGLNKAIVILKACQQE
jgi:hypothetical protein